MIIDVNIASGNWPFRKLKYRNISQLMNLMDKVSIDKCCISSLNNVFYKDIQVGNEDLYKEVKEHSKRFISFGVINPSFPGWQEDFESSYNKLGIKGIKLYPNYHQYDLKYGGILTLLKKTTEYKLQVLIQIRIEDERCHHWLTKVPPVSTADISFVIEKFPELKIILGGIKLGEVKKLRSIIKENDFVFVETSWIDSLNGIDKLVKMVGISKILFGTNMPFFYPQSNLSKVQIENHLPKEDKEKILYKNAQKLLSL